MTLLAALILSALVAMILWGAAQLVVWSIIIGAIYLFVSHIIDVIKDWYKNGTS